ncbi:putative UBC1-E2 ubiquitin-conjugating enzyme [Cystobasidium minutum MCA 4210]|uniref:putative UBC1-E2 ubiquitin-conjugating enzyme n=1 Tax=Cystobasidium minutum MCA 4210 TaxID=1397322 RepID=UPI0034CF5558|eukprot:jgi/Rhomi1/192853/gm1.1067_g
MADPRAKRIAREMADVLKDKASSITVEPFVSDNLMHLKGTFKGPEGTPYEGGLFEVDIQVPERYPFSPLKMKFLTKVYHPNVSSASGAICLDILKDAWTPVLTLRSTLVSLQSLLCSPEPKDPQDAEVAKHYLSDRKGFESTARYWTEIYAKPKSDNTSANKAVSDKTGLSSSTIDEIKVHGLDPEQVSSFMNMGFDKKSVIDVMRRLNYRGANAASVGPDAVVSALLGA